MKSRNHTRTRKCSDRAVWMLSGLLIRQKRERRGDEHGDEIGEEL
jgi:hypothetical protein